MFNYLNIKSHEYATNKSLKRSLKNCDIETIQKMKIIVIKEIKYEVLTKIQITAY